MLERAKFHERISTQDPIAYSPETKVSPIAYSNYSGGQKPLKPDQADDIIHSVTDLIDDAKFNPFFYKKLYDRGTAWFLTQADRARKGKQPSRLFVSLLKGGR